VALAEALEHMLPLCPTCHALAHTSSPPLELDEINALRSS
jgi:predicted HNH restriction endonuclease